MGELSGASYIITYYVLTITSTVSVAFANGSHFDVAKTDGSEEYCKTMYKLSLDASQHPT